MKIQRGSRLSAQFHKPVPLFESEEISRPSKGNEKWKRSNLISSILKLACWRESVSASVLSYRLCCPSLLCPCGAQSRRHGDRWRVRDTCPLSLPLCPPPPPRSFLIASTKDLSISITGKVNERWNHETYYRIIRETDRGAELWERNGETDILYRVIFLFLVSERLHSFQIYRFIPVAL